MNHLVPDIVWLSSGSLKGRVWENREGRDTGAEVRGQGTNMELLAGAHSLVVATSDAIIWHGPYPGTYLVYQCPLPPSQDLSESG